MQLRRATDTLLPSDPRQVTEGLAKSIREQGFVGVSVYISDPWSVTEPELGRIRDVLMSAGVRVAQANADYEVLVGPDEDRRLAGVRSLQRAVENAGVLRSTTMFVRPGSLNPAGPWTPHPENVRPRTIERLCSSLRVVSETAASAGVVLAIEGGAVSPLDTPERVRDVIESVGSAALRFNVDPANFVGSLREAYEPTAAINHLFDVCGPYVVSAHAKDIRYEDHYTVRFTECDIGEGIMDHVTFLRRFAESCPGGFVIIEHTTADALPGARRALDRAALSARVDWLSE